MKSGGIKLSLKALFAGAICSTLMIALVSVIEAYSFATIYNDVVSSGGSSFYFHPLSIFLKLLYLIFGFLLPSYLAAIFAERSYYAHGLVLAIIGCSLSIFNFKEIIENPIISIFVLIFSFGSSLLGVRIRVAQENNQWIKNR